VLGTAAAWASVSLLARSIARLPLFVYRAIDDRAKEIDKAHPMYRLLHDAPNPEMTKFSWLASAVAGEETWGNCYAEIERNGFDQIIGIHPRRPELWRVDWQGGQKIFWYRQPDGKETKLEAARVFHVPALSPDGLVGYAPISLHRRSFALGIAATEYGTRVFQNDARPSVVFQHPKTLSDAAVKRLEEEWYANHTGPKNAGRVAFLEEGMELKEFGFPPEDAQYLDTRKFQRDETDDIFGIPVGFRASAEEGMAIKFVVHTLGQRLVMFEQEMKRQLLPEDDVFAEFAVEGLLRGNTAARFAAYATGRTNGWYSVNEIRAFENLNPIEGGDGYLQPLNMAPINSAEGDPGKNPSPSTGNPNSPVAPVVGDTAPLVAIPQSRNGRTHAEVI
jgi:HK97 family phage portal protein